MPTQESDDIVLTILYASQTGTAADVAERIGREARRRHYRARVSAVDEFPLADLLELDLVVFVVATTGQGDEPTNMRSLWQFLLRADLPDDLMEHLLYTVYGLGDSSYAKYNWPAKKLYRRLESLGAQAFYEKGEADDQDVHGWVVSRPPIVNLTLLKGSTPLFGLGLTVSGML
jgi:sulfite reductase alpha subunit-like flavoprotein